MYCVKHRVSTDSLHMACAVIIDKRAETRYTKLIHRISISYFQVLKSLIKSLSIRTGNTSKVSQPLSVSNSPNICVVILKLH